MTFLIQIVVSALDPIAAAGYIGAGFIKRIEIAVGAAVVWAAAMEMFVTATLPRFTFGTMIVQRAIGAALVAGAVWLIMRQIRKHRAQRPKSE